MIDQQETWLLYPHIIREYSLNMVAYTFEKFKTLVGQSQLKYYSTYGHIMALFGNDAA